MQVFIRKPSVEFYPGIRVDKDTVLEYKDENVEQRLEGLVFHSISRVHGDGFDSVYDTTIYLKDGDTLIFDGEGRGYVKPLESFVTVSEAIDDLENIKGIGEE